MVKVTAAMVKQLRDMTDSPMMECKKALVEADGDIDAAMDILRKNGLAAAAKKAGRATNEGAIGAYISDDGTKGALVEMACETDFVASNAKFTTFVTNLAQVVAEQEPADTDALLACPMNGNTVQDELTELIHIIGENMKIVRFTTLMAPEGALSSYVHMGGKIGVLVSFSFENPDTAQNETFKTFAHDSAMQVAATAPVAATREEVPAETVEHEMTLYKEQAAESGKPENIQQRMAEGRMNKYYKNFVLEEQEFVKDTSMTVSQYEKQASKAVGDNVKIVAFKRLMRGEAN